MRSASLCDQAEPRTSSGSSFRSFNPLSTSYGSWSTETHSAGARLSFKFDSQYSNGHLTSSSRTPPKRLQLTPNSSFQSIRGTVLASTSIGSVGLVVGVFLEEGLTVSSEFGLRSLIRASLRIDIAVSLEL